VQEHGEKDSANEQHWGQRMKKFNQETQPHKELTRDYNKDDKSIPKHHRNDTPV
jgi:hypothetical protein